MSQPVELIQPEGLTTADRCDRCGAAAMVRVELPTGGALLFCHHHRDEHGRRLESLGAIVPEGGGTLSETTDFVPPEWATLYANETPAG